MYVCTCMPVCMYMHESMHVCMYVRACVKYQYNSTVCASEVLHFGLGSFSYICMIFTKITYGFYIVYLYMMNFAFIVNMWFFYYCLI